MPGQGCCSRCRAAGREGFPRSFPSSLQSLFSGCVPLQVQVLQISGSSAWLFPRRDACPHLGTSPCSQAGLEVSLVRTDLVCT